MAEAFARARNQPGINITSAGTDEPSRVNPAAIAVMKEAGIDISAYKSKSLSSVNSERFDIVITLCSRSAGICPVLPGYPERIDWNLTDPASAKGNDEAILNAFRQSRDEIRRLVDDFYDLGYLSALASAGQCANMILDNISDGIIAHDLNRRIFFFNSAAEQITGYQRSEAMNRDCHTVFPGNFCGGKCQFCDPGVNTAKELRYELDITTKNGERRRVAITARHMHDAQQRNIGILVAFRDLTLQRSLERRIGKAAQFAGMIGRDESMLSVFDLIHDVAETNMPVLIQGESGTGKELVAAAIHSEGLRANKPFIAVNCGALPESLLESELFGHVRGAFTGALRDKKGRFELADGGTIFLDEIGDVSPVMQVKLLRVLQEGKFERVGSEITVQVDVRIISATNKNIAREMASGKFREDLYYRLNVVPIFLPPLRNRRGDIPILAEHILNAILADIGKKDISLSQETLSAMMSYDWPGNVRELQNWIRFALVKCKGKPILPEHLPPSAVSVAASQQSNQGVVSSAQGERPSFRNGQIDLDSVRAALSQAHGNKRKAATLLGISRATLYRFLDKVGPID